MKFGYTIIYVRDLKKTLTFYEAAFGFKTKFLAEELYGELDTGSSTTLSFCAEEYVAGQELPFQPLGECKKAPAIEIAFVTEDVPSAFKKAVDVGAQAIKDPYSTPWGQEVAYVRDLNGVLIELCTPMGT